MKQTKLLLATIAMLWCSLTASAHHFAVGGIYYSFESETDLTVRVTYLGNHYDKYSNEYSGAVTIPSAVTYNGKTYRVTSIGIYAFYDCSSLTAINIPESVTSIGESAFSGCSSLTAITIPESVTSIGYEAFRGCSSLTDINIPEGVTSIESYAFRGCSSLTSIIVEEGNTTYDSRDNCNAIIKTSSNCLIAGCSATIIPESVTSIGNYAFYNCSSLTSITIPESVTSIGYYAFSGCSSLTSITIPEGVTSIGGYAFRGTAWYANQSDGVIYINKVLYTYKGTMPENTSIEVKEGTISISPCAFIDCSSLTSITIPESVTSIGNCAFNECTSLKELVIEDGNETLSLGYNESSYAYTGKGLFYDCPLETIYLGRNLSYSSGKSYGYSPFYDQKTLPSVTVGESVTSIGESAFRDCRSLTSITIPESVTSIGNWAFYDCSSLTSITIPESVTSIREYAFSGCSSLTSITFPENSQLTSIGERAFSSCSSLTSITIPESSQLTSIGTSVFYGCSSLTAVHIKDIASWCNIDFDGYSANPLYYAKNLYLNGELVTELTIPNTATAIKSYAFCNCSSLTSITISENSQLTSIGGAAFYNCRSLTSITIPENSQLTSIGWEAFRDCSSLISITIPENSKLRSIGESTFRGCSSLPSIAIPESVTSIGREAFDGCRSLTSITIPESVTSIGNFAFFNCTSLKELVIEDGNETLSLGYNKYDDTGEGLFYDCPLETIYLGRNLSYDSRKKYGYSPFYNQKALTSVTIGESVTSIEDYVFWDCSNLTSITISENSQLTSIGWGAFDGCSSLTAVHIKDIASWCNIDFDGYIANPLYYAKNLYLNGELVTELTIPNTVTAIKSYAFYNCRSLTSITIPESVTRIDYDAFYGCTSLKELVIADGNETLSLGYNKYYDRYTGEGLFYDCPLETIYLGRNLSYSSGKSYGYSPFYNKKALTSVTIGESVTNIGSYAFYNCNSLNKVYIKDIEAWCNIKFGNINSNPLYYAHNLYLNDELVTELTIPNTVTAIKSYAFYNCSSLTSITIPENSQLTSIGWGAFSDCSRLTSITLSEGVTSIGDDSFSGCSNVENLVVKGSAMPYVPSDKLKKIVLYSPAPLQSKGFSATVYQNCMLYVPQQGLARYQIVEPWIYFWNIIAFDTSDIAPAELPEDDSAPIIYDLRGQRVDVPTRGNIYIVNGRKVLY